MMIAVQGHGTTTVDTPSAPPMSHDAGTPRERWHAASWLDAGQVLEGWVEGGVGGSAGRCLTAAFDTVADRAHTASSVPIDRSKAIP